MRALEAVGFALAVIAIVAGLILAMMGGPRYRRHTGRTGQAGREEK